ncbi:hypothetical protein Anapl_00160 [Anas platyrhynchos]|uniref:Uncharacterized protein n=1 Tax=Anas platyrhynchos TaxID=8839 RepID=R0LQV3_ANAPL|nr:hypothetical protein Anapl_00160 [Anas platyrhynchos]
MVSMSHVTHCKECDKLLLYDLVVLGQSERNWCCTKILNTAFPKLQLLTVLWVSSLALQRCFVLDIEELEKKNSEHIISVITSDTIESGVKGKAMYQNCCRRKRGRQQIYSGAGGRANTKEQVAPLSCFESLNTYKDEKYQFFLKAHHFLSSDTIPTCGERITAVENTVAVLQHTEVGLCALFMAREIEVLRSDKQVRFGSTSIEAVREPGSWKCYECSPAENKAVRRVAKLPPDLQLSTDYGLSSSFLPLIVPAQEEAMVSHSSGKDGNCIHSTSSAWEQLSWQALAALPPGAEKVHLGELKAVCNPSG